MDLSGLFWLYQGHAERFHQRSVGVVPEGVLMGSQLTMCKGLDPAESFSCWFLRGSKGNYEENKGYQGVGVLSQSVLTRGIRETAIYLVVPVVC